MQAKSRAFFSIHWGKQQAESFYDAAPKEFDYGPLNRLEVFQESHPAVMQKRIAQLDWKDKLQYSGKPDKCRKLHKHEQMRYRVRTWIEQKFRGGKRLFSFENYKLLPHI